MATKEGKIKNHKFKINEVLVNLLSYKLNSQKTSSNTVLQYLRDLSLLRQKKQKSTMDKNEQLRTKNQKSSKK